MDTHKPQEKLNHFCEYEEARERFRRSNNTSSKSPDKNIANLDEILSKLCRGRVYFEYEGWNSSLFFDILYYSDFKQIKYEVVETFYSELCKIFLKNDLVNDLFNNLKQLDKIPHVKVYIVQGLLKILQVMPKYEKNCLVLKYSPRKIWHSFGSCLNSHIVIRPCAFKVMYSNENFNLAHLNLIFHLLGVEKVMMNGCNLNGRNIQDLLKGLSLRSIGLSECGSSVNDLIAGNNLGNTFVLEELDLSHNPLYNSTLEKLRNIPLKNLNISYSIRTTGTFVQSTWFAENFQTQEVGTPANGNVDILWEDGALRETIEVFRDNCNYTTQENLRKTFKLKLRELYLTGSLVDIQFSQLHFPETLEVLVIKDYTLEYDQVKALSLIPLKKLEIEYEVRGIEPFWELEDSPLLESLEELSVYFGHSSENLISFISAMKLRYFKCEGEILLGDLDSLLHDYRDKRIHLESLFISAQFDELTNKFISGLRNLNNLKVLTIELPNCSLQAYNDILSLINLQESLVSLTLSLKELQSEEISKISLFKRLKKLSFSFDAHISDTYLKTVAAMKSIEDLQVEAVVNGQLDLQCAQSICAIPCITLSIQSDYNCSISNEAFRFLSQKKNQIDFNKNLIVLNIKGTIKQNLAKILGAICWEKICFDQCNIDDESLRIFFGNEDMIYTLNHFIYTFHRDIRSIWENVAKLFLSKLEIRQCKIPSHAIRLVTKAPISRFLGYIFLGDTDIMNDSFLLANISEVDTIRRRFYS